MSIRLVMQLGWQAAESTPKSSASDGPVALDTATVKVLRAWRKTQLRVRMRWDEAWTDTGRVFTAEDGTGAPEPGHRHLRVGGIPRGPAADPARMTFDGAASLAHTVGADIKAISHMLRRSSVTITADTYTSVFEKADAELAESMSRTVPRSRGDSSPVTAAAARGPPGQTRAAPPSYPTA